MTDSEHEVLRVQRRLNNLRGGMKVAWKGRLTQQLDKLSSYPLLSLVMDEFDPNRKFQIAGEAAGTLENPNVDVILQHATPSAFGKGERTVMDPAYRSGLEIPATAIKFERGDNAFASFGIRDVSKMMFVGRSVELKLYKLAIYTPGGHFDWHMDSTHSNKHHATALLALNTSWEGGDLVLRRNGVETRTDMRPKTSEIQPGVKEVILQAVAFYTDTEHKVEPVSDGVRIVFQYDVEVNEESEKDSDGEDEEEEDDGNQSILERVDYISACRLSYEGQATALWPGDKVVVEKIVAIIKELLESGKEEVAFALQHLHRRSSIVREYLKGPDALIYEALMKSGLFNVSLHPVILYDETDGEGRYNWNDTYYACRYDQTLEDEKIGHGKRKRDPRVFYVNTASAIQMISMQDYIEYTGNEAQVGEHKYFGGGMFVRLRSVSHEKK